MSPSFSRQDDQRTHEIKINQVDESEISDNNSEMSVISESNQDSKPESSDLEETKPVLHSNNDKSDFSIPFNSLTRQERIASRFVF